MDQREERQGGRGTGVEDGLGGRGLPATATRLAGLPGYCGSLLRRQLGGSNLSADAAQCCRELAGRERCTPFVDSASAIVAGARSVARLVFLRHINTITFILAVSYFSS